MSVDNQQESATNKTIDNENTTNTAEESPSVKDKSSAFIENLNKELEVSKSKVDENWNLFLRAKAETDNIQRRSRIDLENAHKYSIEKFARELIMVADSLERGLETTNLVDPSAINMHKGMELTYKLFLDTLEKFGIKVTNPQGEEFNPAFHEAISMQTSDEVSPNSILNVVQKGFMLHDRVLRPARVIVAKA
ncbi:MAG: hypothetical protein JWM09_75 [Francisellaceae bacterium]|nr:hypothetical protein [Francisellaceae bacterium]